MSKLNGALQRLRLALLQPINPAVVIFLGGYTILWGIWVINPFWDVFSTAPLFSALGNLIPYESVWGFFALVTGAVTSYGAINRSYGALVRGALFAAMHWLVIAIFYFLGDWANTGGITALIFCLYASYVYLNIKVNHQDDEPSLHGDIFHEVAHNCPECEFSLTITHRQHPL